MAKRKQQGAAENEQQANLAPFKEQTGVDQGVPTIKAAKNQKGVLEVELDKAGWNYIEKTFASESVSFINNMLVGLCSGLSTKGTDEGSALNAGLSFVAAIKPRDELETMLAVQMAAIHNATITFARRLNHVENIPQQDSAERTLNKLARTFTTQMEALRKYRNGGTQKVIVQHINVEDGAQAVIGHVEQTTGRGEG